MRVGTLDLAQWVVAWFWPFVRIAALVSVAPVFGNRSTPARVRLGLALVLSLAIAPFVPPLPPLDPLSGAGLAVTVQQVLIGLALGFSVRLVFTVLEVGGHQVAQLMGLGFASMVDPQSNAQVPVVSQFYILFATLVFLGLDGHLVLIEVLAESFHTLPIAPSGLAVAGWRALVDQAGWMFGAAVVMALPAMAALLTVNLAFGVMTKTAPQLNIFAVGFPVTLIFGFFVMLLTLPSVVGRLSSLFAEAMGLARGLVGGAV